MLIIIFFPAKYSRCCFRRCLSNVSRMVIFSDGDDLYIAGAGEEEAILAPALVLAILPTMYFLQSMLELVEEERREPYYDLATSKGLTKSFILLRHILRNMFVRLAYQAKFLISIMISNLLIVEYLFENFGMTSFLLTYSQPPVFFVTALLFFGPIYLFLKVIELSLYFFTRQEVSL